MCLVCIRCSMQSVASEMVRWLGTMTSLAYSTSSTYSSPSSHCLTPLFSTSVTLYIVSFGTMCDLTAVEVIQGKRRQRKLKKVLGRVKHSSLVVLAINKQYHEFV